MLPDFVVVAPRADAPDRAWLIVGDAKDYERVRSRIDDARLLKGFLQVAFGAEAAEQWSQLPDGLDVHRFGVLAVPRNAFLQPEALVEDLHDHREEVRDAPRRASRRGGRRRVDADGDPGRPRAAPRRDVRPGVVPVVLAVRLLPSELRASRRPASRCSSRSASPPTRARTWSAWSTGPARRRTRHRLGLSALVTATVDGSAAVDRASTASTRPASRARSTSSSRSPTRAALGVHGLGVQRRHRRRPRRLAAYHVFDDPQAPETRRAIMQCVGEAVQAVDRRTRTSANPDDPDPVHLVVPDKATADVLASIADNLAGVELSRLRWERDKEMGRPALTFDGEPATIPARSPRRADRRSRSCSRRTGPARCRCARRSSTCAPCSLGTSSPAARRSTRSASTTSSRGRAATEPVDHRALGDAIEAVGAHTRRAADERAVGRDPRGARRPGRSRRIARAGRRRARYDGSSARSSRYKATTLERALDALDAFPDSRLRGVYRAIEGDAQAVWRRRPRFHASDLVRFGRTYRYWRN